MSDSATRQFDVVTGASTGVGYHLLTGVIGRFISDSVKASMHKKMAKHGSADK